ncbi:MAG: abortive infection protein [Microgenomates group bacterium GW2011_GWC1_39_12]|nr:MAG: abortive infection protein [Microgenomates group bacterium GW2011_GWC1_39_12]
MKVQPASWTTTEWIFQFWAWQLLFWALYRYFFTFPEWTDEFIFKPTVFVLPVIWYVLKKEKASLATIGLTSRHFFKNLLIGLGVSAIFVGEGILVNISKHGNFVMQPFVLYMFILSLVTSFSEELLCRGFFFSRLLTQTKKVWFAIIVATLMFMAFHIPILVTTLKFQGPTLILFFWTTLSLGIINSIFYLQTKSLVIPILIHMFWNITVAVLL